MTVSLGPTLLVLGSVQTFCIDPLKEVFGVEEMAAGADGGGAGGGGNWAVLFWLQLSGQKLGKVNHLMSIPRVTMCTSYSLSACLIGSRCIPLFCSFATCGCVGPQFVGLRSNRIIYSFVFVVELITVVHSA